MTAPSRREGKGGLYATLAAEASAEVGRLAAAAVRSLRAGAGLEAAETAIRAGLLKLGGSVLEQLLAADGGYCGPRVECGAGHQAQFTGYRDKTIDTVLGPVTLSREVKLAVSFTQHEADKNGYPVRDRDSSSYLATFEPAHVFAELVQAEGIRRGAGHVRQLTILGDGAAWIWNLAAAKFPQATGIVDLYHARQHLHELAGVLEFMLGDQHGDWLSARLDDLDNGDIDAIITAARAYPLLGVKQDELDKALHYFEANAPA